MKRIKIISLFIVLFALVSTSCINDLDTKPLDKNTVVPDNLLDRPGAIEQALAKLYSSFAVPGQDGVNLSGDISGIDNGFGVYTRALWMLQELPTDEAICAWNDQTIKDFHWQTWSATDVFNMAMYSRIIYTVTICNEFIRNTEGNDDPDVIKCNSEARFLRALAYFHAIDMYGNPAFVTEADKPGKFFPKQTTRAELFAYVESELRDIADNNKLGEPRFMYGRADKAAAWMLLARLYLNAEVYTGTPRWADCITYCNLVKNAGYILEPDYHANFCADNNLSRELIFAINNDGQYTRSYGGTTYIIHAATGGGISAAALGIGSGWGGNRTTPEFANILTNNYHPPRSDSMFTQVPDKRVYLQLLNNWDIINVGTFTDGIGVRKFSNVNHDGTEAIHPHNDFTCTDFPIFRLADAYLMEAEALLRSGGDRGTALNDINALRERAYGNINGNINDSQLTLDFILDERGRELYWEAVRRTDLIRYGKFTGDAYLWQWKGNSFYGLGTPSYRNLYPLPASEVSANPNIHQNTGY
ncbi:MAG: RagB/SusD family nutrient uptake outer membrane protein [Lentimicrobiaceae bacterium]|nr:RagB/SusD family nutrient uptake outer membrane protein [Lentimicrobiaceae bacterium]